MTEFDLLMSATQALLGRIGPSWRAVTIKHEPALLGVRFYFDGEISEEEREEASLAGTDIIADFPAPYVIADEYIRVDAPTPVPNELGWRWVFLRGERDPNT